MEVSYDGKIPLPKSPDQLPVYDGIILPGFRGLLADTNKKMAEIRELESRESDILICAYPKSGTHWMSEIVDQLIAGKSEYSSKSKGGLLLEFGDFVEAGLDDMPSPRNLNTHVPFRMLPQKHIQLKAKIIHIMRNPKDVAVSLFHHAQKEPYVFAGFSSLKWEDFVQKFVEKVPYGTWFEYEKEWEQVKMDNPDLNVLTVYYENLKLNTEKEITRIADFLGVSHTEELIKQITEKVDFKNVVKQKVDSIDKKSYRELIYRKGQIGDWKNWFTLAQNEMFDAVYEKEMKNSKLQFTFSQ